HHLFSGQLAWQATPRLKFTLADSLTENDDPLLADRLNLRVVRQTYTMNLLSLGSEYALGPIETKEYYRLSTFSSAQQTTTSHTLGVGGSLPLGRIHLLTAGYEYLDSETSGRAPTGLFTGVFGSSTTIGHELTASFSRDLTRERTVGVSAAYAIRNQT